MKAQLILYILQVNLALLLFYLFYMLMFRNDTFNKLRRYYWYLSILFSLVYPLFVVDAFADLFPTNSANPQAAAWITIGETEAMVIDDTPTNNQFPIANIILGIFSVGSALILSKLIWQITTILKIGKQSRKTTVSGIPVLDVSQEIAPFSFFRWIFLHIDSHSEKELNHIIKHENSHVKHWHTMDILIAELLIMAFCWNPIVWLIKREISINLEYLADLDVLQQGIDGKEYQYHLLQLTYHKTAVLIGNNFNVSQLKKRIMMMNKTKSPTQKLVKYLLVLPFACLLIVANSCLNNKDKNANAPTDEMQTQTASTTPEETVLSDADKGEIFTVVEIAPEYPGGTEALMKYLSDQLVYPVEAQENNIQGRVVVNFVVEKDGSLSDFQTVRSVDPLLDAEAIRVLKSMPNWKPGKQKGENVRVKFTLPVLFKLQGEDNASAQKATTPPKQAKSDEEQNRGNEVFVVVEEQPEFPGGQSAMMKYLANNISYPKEAVEKKMDGRVTVGFVVEKDGSLSDFKVIKGIDPLLDNEAIRVIKEMPNWKPGKQKGKNVRVKYTLPVLFKLE